MRFSERMGIKDVSKLLNEEVTQELRNRLWSDFYEYFYRHLSSYSNPNPSRYSNYSERQEFCFEVWKNYAKKPADDFEEPYPLSLARDWALKLIRDWYFQAEWNQVYDFIEMVAEKKSILTPIFNKTLREERSPYRFVNVELAMVTSEEEIKEIENALEKASIYSPVYKHLETSLKHLSDKKSPDYRNSIKESISAVESLVKIMMDNENLTLGKALNSIGKKYDVPNGIKVAFTNLYSYTSDESGIRHGFKLKDKDVDLAEARFMLIACSAFVNFLFSKI